MVCVIRAGRKARLNSLLGLDVDDAPTPVVGSLEVGHAAQPESQDESAVLPSCMHVASRPRPIHVVSARVSRSPGFPSLGPGRANRVFLAGTMAGRGAPPPTAGAGRGAPPPPVRQPPPAKPVATIAAGTGRGTPSARQQPAAQLAVGRGVLGAAVVVGTGRGTPPITVGGTGRGSTAGHTGLPARANARLPEEPLQQPASKAPALGRDRSAQGRGGYSGYSRDGSNYNRYVQ